MVDEQVDEGERSGMVVASAQLEEVLDLYHQGRMLRALEAAKSCGPLKDWRGAAARVMAGRLAMNVGAPQLGRALHRLAHREDPADPEALYYAARGVIERRGPLPGWEMLRRHGELPDAPARVRADWLALHADLLGWFRDFETAERWLARAEQLAPERPWIAVERASLFEREDKYDEALAAARRALALHPWYRPGVQASAHLLQLLNRDHDALDLLREAATRLESGPVVIQLAALETELRMYDEARRTWDRALALHPLLEEDYGKWFAARRSDAAYYCGDIAAAAELAEQSENPFHKDLAPRLREYKGDGGKRIVLPVGFVRQHQMTCAPATLSALSRFWSMPAEHLEVAEQICYDGTPAHSERSWAEQNGFAAREFTVTWDVTVALIDRGIPFTFTTVEPGSAHLQAVIGYDAVRRTLLIRDPYMRYFGEFLADGTAERYKSSGPRGMLMVPRDRADELLAGLELPDAALYDELYELHRALSAHDRSAARVVVERMTAAAPNHRLTLWARRAMAGYDANVTEMLATTDALLELFPGDQALRLSKLSYLRALARRDERLALLKEASEQKGADPYFWQEYAMELKEDAREHPLARRLLRRALRFRRLEASMFGALADILWDQRLTREALELYRFAACLKDMDEMPVRTYFVASRHLKETDAAIQLLRDRCARFGRKSSHPARSLFWAFEQIDRSGEGFTELEKALSLRPTDGELQLAAASAYARHGRFAKADEMLASAKGRTQAMTWTRVAAEVAVVRGRLGEARELWAQVVEAEPLAPDAHRMLAQLIAETQSPAAALAHLEQAANRFPHNYRLTQLWVERMKEEGPEAAEPIIRRLIAIHPADAWARRELVAALMGMGRTDEALVEAEAALRLEPSNPSSHYYAGLVRAAQGKLDEARAAYRAAITASVDAEFAIAQLMFTCGTVAEKKEALAFVQQELVRQTIFGEGLLAYRAHARDVLSREELHKSLSEALEARPDLWHAWSAMIDQLAEMGQLEDAERVAMQATERIPLLPRLWLDLANVRRALGRTDDEIAALRTALEINPGWGEAVRQLAAAFDRRGEFAESRKLLEQTIERSPLDPYNHGCLADLLWKTGDRTGAIERVRHAVKLEPGYSWAWDALGFWAAEMEQPDLADQTARELTKRRAGEVRSWLVLARALRKPDQLQERLDALAKAVELNPRGIEAYDMRAKLLAEAGRFDEALASCRPAAWGEHLPSRLQARSAWIEAERGNIDAAIAQMREVVNVDPNFYWAWTCLADWYRATQATQDYVATAEQLRRLWPLEAIPMGYLGDARLLAGDRAGARQILRAVVERFPDYDFAVNRLFALEIEDDDRAAAAEMLAVIRRQQPGLPARSRAVRFAARFESPDIAAQALRDLLGEPHLDHEWLDPAIEAMAVAGMRPQIIVVLREALAREDVSPIVGAALVEQLCKGLWWEDARQVAEQALARGEIGRRAAQALLLHLSNGQQVRQLKRFLRGREAQLRADTLLWGWVGYAWQTVRRYRKVIDWMADWRQRDDAEAWMLVNIAEAYRALGRDAEARQVHDHASALPAHPEPRGIHLLWLAADAALAGATSDAADLLRRIDMSAMRPPYRFLRNVIDALLSARDGRSFAHTNALLKQAESAYPGYRLDRELLRFYRRAVGKLITTQHGVFGRLSYLVKRFQV